MDILTSKADGIFTIEFNRPEKKNAITQAMYQMMGDAIAAAERDPEIRAILIQGKPEIFTAGNALEDFQVDAAPDLETRPATHFMRQLSGATKPVIAAVAGAAIGIGTTMLVHCDIVYAADNAKFSLPFAPLGLCPEFGSSYLLPKIVGNQRAAEMLLLGEGFSAEEAYEMGFVSRVVPAMELHEFARMQAAKLVALPASSLRVTKRLLKSGQAKAVQERIAEENRQFAAMLASPEATEAFAAFFEKRRPDFKKFA